MEKPLGALCDRRNPYENSGFFLYIGGGDSSTYRALINQGLSSSQIVLISVK